MIRFPKERHSSKQANILILKTILFISQNMFQSIHNSSSVAKSIIKTVNILIYIYLKNVTVLIKAERFT